MTRPSRQGRRRDHNLALACAVALSFAPGLKGGAAFARTPSVNADPLEGANRAFFAFNQCLDHILIRPAAMTYQRVLPNPVRQGLRNAASNLGEPSVAVNDILQGRGSRGLKSAARFAINSTVGVFGLFDLARRAGLSHHPNDFGITLARFGVTAGPYLVIPVAGPNTVRDALGNLADLALNPLAYARYTGDKAVGITSVVSAGLDTRAEADQSLKALEASATDPYASLRSFWLQNREAQITGGKINLDALPDFDATSAPAAQPSQPNPHISASPHDAGASAAPGWPSEAAVAGTDAVSAGAGVLGAP